MLYLIGFLLLWMGMVFAGWNEPADFVNRVILFVREHGTGIVAVGAFIEGVVLINLYFPGSIMIAAAIVSSQGNPRLAVWFSLVCYAAFCGAAILNYVFGRVGFSRLLPVADNSQARDTGESRWRRLQRLLLSAYPNFAAFQQVEAGLLRLPLKTFAARVATGYGLGVTLCALAVYFFANQVIATASNPFLICIILGTWWAFVFWRALSGAKTITPSL